MSKSREAFRTISEVADWLETPAHVLRFWESKFAQVKPVKRAGGRRYYRPADMELLGGIKRLLHDDGMTIKGVQKLLREKGVRHVAAMSPPLDFVVTEDEPQQRGVVVPFGAPGELPLGHVPQRRAEAAEAARNDTGATAAPARPEEEGPPPEAARERARSESAAEQAGAPEAPPPAAPEAPRARPAIKVPEDPAVADFPARPDVLARLYRGDAAGLAGRAPAIAPIVERLAAHVHRLGERAR
jgi:DNA-binding transcriptional MerR regulator